MLLSLLLACSDPGPALLACEAVPGLHVDSDSLEALRAVLSPAEIRALEASSPTLGSEAVDRAALRAATRCEGVLDDGKVALVRTSPAVDDDGALGEPVESRFTWDLADDRVTTGLLAALVLREALPSDPIEAESAWEALVAAYPDPTLAVDLAHARKEAEKARYVRDFVTLRFEVTEPGRLLAHVKNTGERKLVDPVFVARFEGRDEHRFTRTELGPDQAATLVESAPGAQALAGWELVSFELEPLPR